MTQLRLSVARGLVLDPVNSAPERPNSPGMNCQDDLATRTGNFQVRFPLTTKNIATGFWLVGLRRL
jgi:hypothetical protein